MTRKPGGFEHLSLEETNWRDEQQARNLAEAVRGLGGLPVLVWCGNHHLAKDRVGEWRSMGSRLRDMCGIEPFAIDQALTVSFDESRPSPAGAWSTAFASELDRHGTAGFLSEDAPDGWLRPALADAFLLSTDNNMI